MASVSISSFLKGVTDWLSLIRSSPTTSSTTTTTVKDDLEKLERMLQRIKAVLVDAEERQIEDQSVKLWLKELKDVAYDAEDVLEEYHYHVSRAQVENRAIAATSEDSRKRKHVEGEEEVMLLASSASSITASKVSILNSIANRIKNIRKRFKEISRDRDRLHLKPEDGQRRTDGSSEYPQPTSHMVNEQDIYGREDEKIKLIDWLFSDLESKFQVLAVVGKGGLGKTTLVQLIYNDKKVSDYFKTRMWVCVSDDFNLARLTRAMIESIKKEACTLADQLSPLQESLHMELEGKKVLLVLDDVWNENRSLWESLSTPLHGAKMIRIIVTARNESVAKVMQTTNPYHLGYLPEDQCWQLFVHRAFCGRDREQFPSLVELGKKIVKKCDGLPLAVKSLGGLLQHEIDEDKWKDVLHSKLWDNEKEILPALMLSYIRMPSHLKPCFEICSMFPKDYEFSKDELNNLWATHGYIQRNEGKNDAKKIGYTYFNELQKRSFFDEFHRMTSLSFGDADKFYKMHDNIHDLAHYVHVGMDLNNNGKHKIRHFSIVDKSPEFNLDGTAALRTLILKGFGKDAKAIDDILQRNITSLTHVRYLYIRYYSRKILLPNGLRNLICLRYLELKSDRNLRLPKSFGDLYNLVVLKINCDRIVQMPETLRTLVSLTTIEFRGFENKKLPALGQLPSLISLTLRGFFQVESIGNEFYRGQNNQHGVAFPSLTSLEFSNMYKWKKWDKFQEGDFPQLRHLSIDNKSPMFNFDYAGALRQRNITRLTQLRYLYISYFPGEILLPDGLRNLICLQHLELVTDKNMRLPKSIGDLCNLAVLKITCYGLVKMPETLGKFVSLTTIYFHGFHNEQLPALGQLPSLMSLTLDGLNNLKSIGNEFYRVQSNQHCVAFPSLTSLEFRNLSNWRKWDEFREGDFPHLQKLSLLWHLIQNKCKWLKFLPVKKLCLPQGYGELKKLELSGTFVVRIDEVFRILKNLVSPKFVILTELQNAHDAWNDEGYLRDYNSSIEKLMLAWHDYYEIFGVQEIYSVLDIKRVDDDVFTLDDDGTDDVPDDDGTDDLPDDDGDLPDDDGTDDLPDDYGTDDLPDDDGDLPDDDGTDDVSDDDGDLPDDDGTDDVPDDDGTDDVSDDDGDLPDDDGTDDVPDDDGANFVSDIDDGTNHSGFPSDDMATFFTLEKLQTHTNLKELHIFNYHSAEYPSWIGHPSFDSLTEIKLCRCSNYRLPTLGQLPFLQVLILRKISRLTTIENEFCRGTMVNNDYDATNVAFPSLTFLQFSDMYDWEKWCGVLDQDFPCLKTLQAYSCPNLRTDSNSFPERFLKYLDELLRES